MFQNARIKLTAWYVLIIAIISVLFSIAIYVTVNRELERLEHSQIVRQLQWQRLGPGPAIAMPDDIDVSEVRFRIIMTLGLVDASIVLLSSLAGYFLAGRTLAPIAEMVDDQNRFIADASHELRTPLTSLKSEIEVTLRDKKIGLRDTKALLVSNLEEVNKLQNLSDNLIKLTQYHKVNGNMTFKEESIKNIISESMSKVSGVAKAKKIKIISNVKDTKIEVEKNTLTELFVILLDNAVKYSGKGKKVTVESSKTDGHIIVKVADQGIGITKEDVPHIFERFYRGDKSRTKSDTDGYGLGLSIAKEIVSKHNGSIAVESDSGKGTIFSVKLPVKHSLSLI